MPKHDDQKKRLIREREALRKLLDDKLELLRSLKQEGAKTYDRQWEIVGDILEHEPPLWQGRYTSEAKFIAKELPEFNRRDVARNVLVAGAFRPEDIESYTISFLEELALYVKEKGGMTERPRALDLPRIVVDVRGDRVRANKATIDDVKAARKSLGKKAKRSKDGPRAAAVRKAITRRKRLSNLNLTLTEAHATFARVPLDELDALAKALSTLKLPPAES